MRFNRQTTWLVWVKSQFKELDSDCTNNRKAFDSLIALFRLLSRTETRDERFQQDMAKTSSATVTSRP